MGAVFDHILVLSELAIPSSSVLPVLRQPLRCYCFEPVLRSRLRSLMGFWCIYCFWHGRSPDCWPMWANQWTRRWSHEQLYATSRHACPPRCKTGQLENHESETIPSCHLAAEQQVTLSVNTCMSILVKQSRQKE